MRLKMLARLVEDAGQVSPCCSGFDSCLEDFCSFEFYTLKMLWLHWLDGSLTVQVCGFLAADVVEDAGQVFPCCPDFDSCLKICAALSFAYLRDAILVHSNTEFV
ncbi:hypothetical protein Dimus_024214 [Dionaea muscipula]